MTTRSLSFPISKVQAVLDRFPRSYDPLEVRARERLAALSQAEADPIWSQIAEQALLSPSRVTFLWPKTCAAKPQLLPLLRKLGERTWTPGRAREEAEAARRNWVLDQGNAEAPQSLMNTLLQELASGDPSEGAPFSARYYAWRDLVVANLVAPELLPVQQSIMTLLDLQVRQWGRPYCAGYAYQGYARLGIAGIKPSEERLARYGFLPWLKPHMSVLDIGCNNGFLATEISRHVARVEAIELNPFLVEIGRLAAKAQGQNNIQFTVADFSEFRPSTRFDIVLSFANHCTIDGNLAVDLEDYIAKLWQLTAEGGWLFFESHNVFKAGTGQAGDDGDLDKKFEIIERYFELVDHTMTERFVPVSDVDKLFVVLKRRPEVLPVVTRMFSLALAKQRYHYSANPFGLGAAERREP